MSLSFASCHILGSEKMHNETIMTNLSDFQQIKNQTVASKTEWTASSPDQFPNYEDFMLVALKCHSTKR